jgi:biotin carboxyl carrier protein
MPGTVVRVEVSAGDAVKAGQDLVFIEAMKMETPVKAAKDGTIASVNVAKGESVDTGKVLLTMN